MNNKTLPLLQIENLGKTFRDGQEERRVFGGLSEQVAPGEFVALWGPSGSGKSTLLNILAGVLPADTGSLCLRDKTGAEHVYGQLGVNETTGLRRALIGYVFQFFNLIPTLTLRENVDLVLKLANCADLAPVAFGRLDELGLTHRLHAFPETLSGGEQQRAAIARALAHEPRLVLADEPTGNLDAANAARVMDALLDAVRSSSCALIIATHDDAVAQRADRIINLV